MKKEYDCIVIGSGPGGEGAAMRLAKAGRRVAVVERHDQVGGGSTHWGTIPSKALREAARRAHAEHLAETPYECPIPPESLPPVVEPPA